MSKVYYDVFNGDADGLCALQQLRLAEPVSSQLITGVKRDIGLLKQVVAQPEDQITVLDIALDQNREALLRLLSQGVYVHYFDHHTTSDIPIHANFTVHIDTIPDKGTSLLVDEYLGGRFRAWAIVGTFGDNFDSRANQLAKDLDYTAAQTAQLRNLGIALNYNSYGLNLQDLHIPPQDLSLQLRPFIDPLEFIAVSETFKNLNAGYMQDMAQLEQVKPEFISECHEVYVLPDAPWARRVSGVFANQLVHKNPKCANALLTRLPGGGFLVSVRAPKDSLMGADVLCRQFPTGGGRKAAAGINLLPEDQYSAFLTAFIRAF